MPTVLRVGPYRFFFYSNENGEPPHIHIQRERMLATFWLQPVALASSTRFSPAELRKLEKLVGEKKPILWRIGMNTLAVELHPLAQDVKCTDEALVVQLLDGRTISAPLIWFPRLAKATKEQLNNWELLGDGDGIHWPEVDEDLSVKGLLAGTH